MTIPQYFNECNFKCIFSNTIFNPKDISGRYIKADKGISYIFMSLDIPASISYYQAFYLLTLYHVTKTNNELFYANLE